MPSQYFPTELKISIVLGRFIEEVNIKGSYFGNFFDAKMMPKFGLYFRGIFVVIYRFLWENETFFVRGGGIIWTQIDPRIGSRNRFPPELYSQSCLGFVIKSDCRRNCPASMLPWQTPSLFLNGLPNQKGGMPVCPKAPYHFIHVKKKLFWRRKYNILRLLYI